MLGRGGYRGFCRSRPETSAALTVQVPLDVTWASRETRERGNPPVVPLSDYKYICAGVAVGQPEAGCEGMLSADVSSELPSARARQSPTPLPGWAPGGVTAGRGAASCAAGHGHPRAAATEEVTAAVRGNSLSPGLVYEAY